MSSSGALPRLRITRKNSSCFTVSDYMVKEIKCEPEVGT